MLTLRKKIAELLERESLDLREISKLLGIKEREATSLARVGAVAELIVAIETKIS